MTGVAGKVIAVRASGPDAETLLATAPRRRRGTSSSCTPRIIARYASGSCERSRYSSSTGGYVVARNWPLSIRSRSMRAASSDVTAVRTALRA